MALALDGLRVVDADTHLTESHDLWTKRAPAKYKDRVPHVVEVDGKPMWYVDGVELGFAGGGGVIDRDGNKGIANEALFEWTQERIHLGAFDIKARIDVMDDSGVHAQVCFPNSIGLGGQGISDAVEDPNDVGGPDLANKAWDPLWDVCEDRHLPVHFHIGASLTAMTFFGQYPWESQDENTKLAIGGTLLFIGNARVVTNIILSGMLDRHPKLQMVSVESGVGWVPFILETLDYEMSENAPEQLDALSMKPSEYFKRNLYATFWFERTNLPTLVETVGADRILFETDFPHPTCLYPKPLDTVAEKMSVLAPDVQRKILGENAAKLYRL
jgi:hypothetical protein